MPDPRGAAIAEYVAPRAYDTGTFPTYEFAAVTGVNRAMLVAACHLADAAEFRCFVKPWVTSDRLMSATDAGRRSWREGGR